MAFSLKDLDAIIGYDPGTHSVAGLPTLGPKSTTADLPSTQAIQADILANRSRNAPAAGSESIQIPSATPTTGLPTNRIAGSPDPNSVEKLLSRAQEKGGVGQRLYKADIPSVTATPGTADYGEQRQARLDYEKMHPWGSAVSEHPGVWGKIAHGLATAGNIAGNVVAPGVMANIPGTELNKERQAAQNANWIKLGGEEEQKKAQTGLEKEQTEATHRENELVPWNGQQITRKEWAPLEAGREREQAEATAAAEREKFAQGQETERQKAASESQARAFAEADARQTKQIEDADKRQDKQLNEEDKKLRAMMQHQADVDKRKDEGVMGYAADAQGNLIYTNKSDAAARGATFEEIKPPDVNKDRQAIRQLNDVQQNVSRYRKAIGALKGDIPQGQVTAMERILSDKQPEGLVSSLLTIGPQMQMVGQGEVIRAWNQLEPPERELVQGYLRAKSSVIAYQKALTGIGRTNKETMELEMAQLPHPGVGASVAVPQMNAFQENIDRASEGFPTNLPGLKSPAQTRRDVEGAPAAGGPPAGANIISLNDFLK